MGSHAKQHGTTLQIAELNGKYACDKRRFVFTGDSLVELPWSRPYCVDRDHGQATLLPTNKQRIRSADRSLVGPCRGGKVIKRVSERRAATQQALQTTGFTAVGRAAANPWIESLFSRFKSKQSYFFRDGGPHSVKERSQVK